MGRRKESKLTAICGRGTDYCILGLFVQTELRFVHAVDILTDPVNGLQDVIQVEPMVPRHRRLLSG
jgi:hypothetical protein